jgi:hypothetical protein
MMLSEGPLHHHVAAARRWIAVRGTSMDESVKKWVENDRGNPRVEKGLPLPLPPQNPYPCRG